MFDDTLKLFDDIERTYTKWAGYSESSWIYLNRVSRPGYDYLRKLLQNWFDHYDASPVKRRNLQKEFRSENDKEHLSAFFELYVYSLFKQLGYAIEVEPVWQGKHPDFMLTSTDGMRVLLEVAGTYPDREYGIGQQLEAKLLDYLDNKINSPDFFLQVRLTSYPQGDISYRPVADAIQRALGRLNYDEIATTFREKGLVDFHLTSWTQGEWSVEVFVIPKTDHARGKADSRPISIVGHEARWIDTESEIRSPIDNKYRKYAQVQIPYLLFLNLGSIHADHNSIVNALFGDDEGLFDVETGEVTPSRKPNGSWVGPNGFQKKGMSGIGLFQGLRPTNLQVKSCEVWHHPAANLPIAPELLVLPQRILNYQSHQMDFREGVSPATILGIDPEQMPY
jgi:hypothetical protein